LDRGGQQSAATGPARDLPNFDINLCLHKRNGTASHERTCDPNRKDLMLWTIFVILLVLWLLGLVSSYTLGGFIHILLVIAIVVLIINLIQGRRPL
jgi:hypothetical protein